MKIAQEINMLTDEIVTALAGSSADSLCRGWVTSSGSYWNLTTWYFEVYVTNNDSSNSGTVELKSPNDTILATATIPANGTYMIRTSSFAPWLSSYNFGYIKANAGVGGSLVVHQAKCLIIQDGAVAYSTGLYPGVGYVTGLNTASLTTYSHFPRYFKYNASDYDGDPSVTRQIGATFESLFENNMGSARLALQRDNPPGSFTGWYTVGYSTKTSEVWSRNAFGNYTLSDGANYRLAYSTDGAMYSLSIRGAVIWTKIFSTTGIITKIVVSKDLVNHSLTGAGIKSDHPIYWDLTNDFEGVTTTVYHEQCSDGETVQLVDENDVPIVSTSISGAGRIRSSSFPIPSSGQLIKGELI